MTTLVEVVGKAARDSTIAGATTVYQVEFIGGGETFATGSFLTGFAEGSNTPPIITGSGPQDNTVWRILYD